MNSYPSHRLKIIVDKRPKLQIYTSRCQDCESCSESFELFWQPLSPVRVPRDTAINASQLSSITLIYTWQKKLWTCLIDKCSLRKSNIRCRKNRVKRYWKGWSGERVIHHIHGRKQLIAGVMRCSMPLHQKFHSQNLIHCASTMICDRIWEKHAKKFSFQYFSNYHISTACVVMKWFSVQYKLVLTLPTHAQGLKPSYNRIFPKEKKSKMPS